MLTVVFFCWIGARIVCADGVYIPEKAYLTMPGIPAQRAFISYKDTNEILIIESTLDAQGQAFGWILPLPSVPTEIAEQAPGLLATLSMVTQPVIIHDIGMMIILLFAVILSVGVFIYFYLESCGCFMAFIIVVFFLFFGGLGGLFFNTANQESGYMPGIYQHSTGRIGNYDITVLSASSAEVLNQWLSTNDFASLPAGGEEIVKRYISNGWVFAVMKLHRDYSGLTTPHPLELHFTSPRPVYPLQLTALAETAVYLELFVWADRRSEHSLLNTRYCDRFMESSSDEAGREYRGETYNEQLRHSSLGRVMIGEGVLTAMEQKIEPASMTDDLWLSLVDYSPARARVFSVRGCVETSVGIFIIIWLSGLGIAVVIHNVKLRSRYCKQVSIRTVVKYTLAASMAAGIIAFVSIPKNDVRVNPINGHWYNAVIFSQCRHFVSEHESIGTNSNNTISQRFSDYLRQHYTINIYSGTVPVPEESPGNFALTCDGKTIVLTLYTHSGTEDRCTIDLPGKEEEETQAEQY